MIENPLLAAFSDAAEAAEAEGQFRDRLIERYAFAVPTHAALAEIAAASPDGVIELGAGTGYWAMLLASMGVDVVAVDVDPPPSSTNPWFGESESWFDVAKGDELVPALYPARTLLIVWPTRGASWAADGVRRYHSAGGRCVAYVGEPPWGENG